MTEPVALDLDHLRTWIGRSETVEDRIDPRRAAQMAGTLGMSGAPQEGDDLPPAWHWVYFTPTPHAEQTGPDGHPARGGFLPPVPLPRRMWAGSDVTCHAPLPLGTTARRESTISNVEAKDGRAGQLVFVTVEHVISTESGERALEERQHIVYREPPSAGNGTAGAREPERPAMPQQWRTSVTPDPVMLFRYSALTFNGHRIHYDRDYAMQEEGYAGLVVHGPLIATLLLKLACDKLGSVDLAGFSFRARRPLFDGAAMTLCGECEGDRVTLCALTPEGELAMHLDARLAKD